MLTTYWMMCHTGSGKWGISVKQSNKLGTTHVQEIECLKYHARVGHIKDPFIGYQCRCSWPEGSVQLVLILQLGDRSFHGIDRIRPVEIQYLIGIQNCMHSCFIVACKQHLQTKWELQTTFSKWFFENFVIVRQHGPSDFLCHGAQWWMLDVRRLEV